MSSSTENLEKHRDRGADVGHVVSKCKVSRVRIEARSDLKVHIRLSDLGYPGGPRVDEGVQAALVERQFIRARHRCGVLVWRSFVAQDAHILTVLERRVEIAQRTNPIVSNRLVGRNNHRVALTSENGYRINFYRLDFGSIYLNNGHSMTINREVEGRIARCGNQTEAIS